jgi:hypothetical protein
MSDLLFAVVGDVPSSVDEMPLDEMKEKLDLTAQPEKILGNYHTVVE